MLIIGDIHGCIKTLEALLEEFPDEKEIYTVGDLIDRGPGIKEVVQLCIDRDIKSVMGNHEHMFLDFLGEQKYYPPNIFLENGGDVTLRSYPSEKNGGDVTLEAYKSGVPESHLEYFKGMPYHIETDRCIITHAGVHPAFDRVEDAHPTEENMNAHLPTCIWNRQAVKKMDKLQIFGHTPHSTNMFTHTTEQSLDIANCANIDTGCYYTTKFGKDYKHSVGLNSGYGYLVGVQIIDDEAPIFKSVECID